MSFKRHSFKKMRSVPFQQTENGQGPSLKAILDDIADISNKDFNPEGKPSEDGDYWFTKSWFSKDDRKQRGG